MCSTLSWIINKSKFAKRFKRVLEDTDSDSLSPHNKLIIIERFLPMVNHTIKESIRSNVFYFLLQTTITIGSIFVPALLSVEEKNIIINSTAEEDILYAHNLYWTIWCISLAVTISNAVVQLTNMDKKYVMRTIHVSQLKKEGWLFIQKAGSVYGRFKNNNHNSFINLFWNRIEKFRFSQILSDLSFDKIDDDINLLEYSMV